MLFAPYTPAALILKRMEAEYLKEYDEGLGTDSSPESDTDKSTLPALDLPLESIGRHDSTQGQFGSSLVEYNVSACPSSSYSNHDLTPNMEVDMLLLSELSSVVSSPTSNPESPSLLAPVTTVDPRATTLCPSVFFSAAAPTPLSPRSPLLSAYPSPSPSFHAAPIMSDLELDALTFSATRRSTRAAALQAARQIRRQARDSEPYSVPTRPSKSPKARMASPSAPPSVESSPSPMPAEFRNPPIRKCKAKPQAKTTTVTAKSKSSKLARRVRVPITEARNLVLVSSRDGGSGDDSDADDECEQPCFYSPYLLNAKFPIPISSKRSQLDKAAASKKTNADADADMSARMPRAIRRIPIPKNVDTGAFYCPIKDCHSTFTRASCSRKHVFMSRRHKFKTVSSTVCPNCHAELSRPDALKRHKRGPCWEGMRRAKTRPDIKAYELWTGDVIPLEGL